MKSALTIAELYRKRWQIENTVKKNEAKTIRLNTFLVIRRMP